MGAVLHTEMLEEFWRNELNGAQPAGLPIYLDASRENGSQARSRLAFDLELDAQQTEKLSWIHSPDMLWLALYTAFLHRISQETDFFIGVGDVNGGLLPLRLACRSEDTLQSLITSLSDKLVRAMEHSLPWSQIESLAGGGLAVQSLFGEWDGEQPASSLWHWAVRLEHGIWRLHVEYDGQSIREETMLHYADCYKQLARSGLLQLQQPVDRMDMATDKDIEAYRLLNDTVKLIDGPLTIVERFRQVAHRYPDRPALSWEQTVLTYRELDERSDRCARALLEKGLQRGDYVVLYMERSLEAVIGLIGVLKAGGAYVPLDPEHPDERNSFILEDTASRYVLVKKAWLPRLQGLYSVGAGTEGAGDRFGGNGLENGKRSGPHLLCMEELESASTGTGLAASDSQSVLSVKVESDDTAYVIYTSGSTGKPKGVLIAHAGVVNLAEAIQAGLELSEEDVLLQFSTFSFDASVYDLFGSMLNGCRLHLLNREERFSVEAFTAALEQVKATRISILPTVFFNQLATYLKASDRRRFSRIKSIVVGGEALPGELVRKFQAIMGSGIKIVNAYGPTECTVASTTFTIKEPLPEQISTVCIGAPLHNYQVYIVNEQDRLCPVQVPGELLISSIGVGKGYLNQPDKTAQAFVPDPLQPGSGKIFYRSGDMVRLLADGQIEYLGRKDNQVKIRGYRIEIGEIEDNLVKHPQVTDAAVIAAVLPSGEKCLVAYYTSPQEAPAERAELVRFLAGKVPSYMVPERFARLGSLPVTPSGKVDRKALTARVLPPVEAERAEGVEYVAPVTQLELRVCQAWERGLNRNGISMTDNFFDIGGHSLKILEILVALKPHYPLLKINDFFECPTLAGLCSRIAGLQQAMEAAAAAETHELGGNGTGGEGLGEIAYRPLGEHPGAFKPAGGFEVLSEQRHILLTGATGYLGSHILYELLHRTNASIYCLMRPHASYGSLHERLEAVMGRYWDMGLTGTLRTRVIAVEGDLEKEDLGLSAADRYLLNQKVDAVIHCGAEVRHFGDAAYFTRVNVDSTDRLLAFARQKPGVRFHYISTLGIPEELALGGQWESFLEQDDYSGSARAGSVYTQSKLEAERLAVQACLRERIPVTVYRVGNLVGRSDNGMFQPNIGSNAFYRMLKAMLLLGKAPRVRALMDLTPVDYAGASIAALLLRPDTAGELFHICNPVQLGYDGLVGHFQEQGYSIGFMEVEEYEAWLLDSATAKSAEGLQLAMTHLEGDGAKHSPWYFSCEAATARLALEQVVCAAPDRDLLAKLARHAVETGFFPLSNQT